MSAIVAIPVVAIHRFWAHMLPGLKELLNKGTHPYTTQDIKEWLHEGSWVAFARHVNDQPIVYFVCRIKPPVFEVGLCWGEGMEEWLDDTLDTFETIARQAGCDKISVVGRPGWVKLGLSRGFKPRSTTIVKEL